MRNPETFRMRPDREDLKKLARDTQIKLTIMGFAAVFAFLVGLVLHWPLRFATFGAGDWFSFSFTIVLDAFFVWGFFYVYRNARRNRDGGLVVVYAGKITRLELESDSENRTFRVHFGSELSCVVDHYTRNKTEVGKTMAIRLWEHDQSRVDFTEDPETIRLWHSKALPTD